MRLMRPLARTVEQEKIAVAREIELGQRVAVSSHLENSGAPAECPSPPRNLRKPRFLLDTAASVLYATPMTTTEGPIIIDTPEGLAFFQLLQLEGRLSIEINTGLKFRGPNTRQFVNQKFGQDFKASAKGKQAALDFVRAKIKEAKIERHLDRMFLALQAEGMVIDPSDQGNRDWLRPAAINAVENGEEG